MKMDWFICRTYLYGVADILCKHIFNKTIKITSLVLNIPLLVLVNLYKGKNKSKCTNTQANKINFTTLV